MATNDIKKTKKEIEKAKEEVFQVLRDMRDVRKEILNTLLGFERRRERRNKILGLREEE